MEVQPVVVQQLLDMAERLMRQAFRHHLSAAGMVGLNHVFRIVGLLEEVEDFPVKFVGASVLPAAVRPQPQAPDRAGNSSAGRFSLSATTRAAS